MADFDDIEKLKGDVKIPLKTLFKRIFKYLKPEMPYFVISMLLIIINVGLTLLVPNLVAAAGDELYKVNGSLTIIIAIACGYLGSTIVAQILAFFESNMLHTSGQKIIYNLRMEVYEHIENMSQNQFNEMPVGSLVTRVTNYTTSLSDLFTHTLINLLRNFLTLFIVLGMMLFKSVKLSLILLIFVAVVFVASLIFSKLVKKAFANERKYTSDLNTFLNENLSGMKITQLFNQEKKKENEFKEKNHALLKANYSIVLAFGVYRPLITLLYYGAIAVTFIVGIRIEANINTVLSFYYYLSYFFNPVQNIADQLNNIQKAVTASERLFNLIDVPPEIIDEPDSIEIDSFKGEIEFKNVWFSYIKDQWILKDVSFHINPKETVAFVGATGAGKTTILSLIVRNYEIQKGEILIDGINIKKIKVQSLRKCIGQMLQDVFLFSGSLKSNITLHDDSFTDEEILETCKYVNADLVIDKLDKGLNSEIIERGENLSQGERQLISFARTVLHKPQILILDEATANIDTETEKVIQDSLDRIKNIGTMLVVAHRLSTIQGSDQIIVLQHGEIIESGTHQQLLKKKGYYYKLYQVQFENQN